MIEQIFWLIAFVVLILIEIITLGLTSIWFAAGAFVALIASFIGAGVPLQITLFVLVSLVLLFFTRPVAMKYLNSSRVATNVSSLIGLTAKVTETIDNKNAQGTVVINGQEWSARSKNNTVIEAGSMVKVVDIKGVKAIVTVI